MSAYLCMECLSFVNERGECPCTWANKPGARKVSEFVSREMQD